MNDVHKAAGGAAKHKVPNWQRADDVQALVAELEDQKRSSNVLYVRKGRGVTGTYAVKELGFLRLEAMDGQPFPRRGSSAPCVNAGVRRYKYLVCGK